MHSITGKEHTLPVYLARLSFIIYPAIDFYFMLIYYVFIDF